MSHNYYWANKSNKKKLHILLVINSKTLNVIERNQNHFPIRISLDKINRTIFRYVFDIGNINVSCHLIIFINNKMTAFEW